VFGTPYRFHLVHDGGGWKIDDGDDGAAAEDEPANANERAAVAAMRAYNKAWADADCDAYLATTSGAFRESLSLSTCSAFIPAAKDSHEFTNFTLTPTDIERPSPTRMEIKSHEIFDATTDPQGRPLDKPIPIDRYYLYTLDLVDGSWVISSNPPLR
jgi:hypothetical protein